MHHENKTKKQLIIELAGLPQQVAELEAVRDPVSTHPDSQVSQKWPQRAAQ